MGGNDFSDSAEFSTSGNPIVRHTEPNKPFELAFGSEDADLIGQHITTHLGEADFVWHEVISTLIHIDVHHVAPTPERNYHTLVTSGMSDRPMTIPANSGASPYAELMLCLPASWPLDLKSGILASATNPASNWPAMWLKYLARFPHDYDTWLGWGHTLPNGDPPAPLHSSTRLCCALFLPPQLVPDDFRVLQVSEEKSVHFWAVVPIYAEEMKFKLEVGTDSSCTSSTRSE